MLQGGIIDRQSSDDIGTRKDRRKGKAKGVFYV
jgi:hypothetical protein